MSFKIGDRVVVTTGRKKGEHGEVWATLEQDRLSKVRLDPTACSDKVTVCLPNIWLTAEPVEKNRV